MQSEPCAQCTTGTQECCYYQALNCSSGSSTNATVSQTYWCATLDPNKPNTHSLCCFDSDPFVFPPLIWFLIPRFFSFATNHFLPFPSLSLLTLSNRMLFHRFISRYSLTLLFTSGKRCAIRRDGDASITTPRHADHASLCALSSPLP